MPAAVSRKVHEVQKFMTEANYTTAQFVVQAKPQVVGETAPGSAGRYPQGGREAEEWIRGAIAQSEKDAEAVIRKAGMQIHQLTPEARPLFIKATEPVRQAFATKSGELAKKLIDLALGIK